MSVVPPVHHHDRLSGALRGSKLGSTVRCEVSAETGPRAFPVLANMLRFPHHVQEIDLASAAAVQHDNGHAARRVRLGNRQRAAMVVPVPTSPTRDRPMLRPVRFSRPRRCVIP